MKKFLLSEVLFTLFFLSSITFIYASPIATFSAYPNEAAIGQEFTVNFSIIQLDTGINYFVKSRIGINTSNLAKGQTKSSDGNSWLSDNSGWDSGFPQFSTDNTGKITGQIVSRISTTVSETGQYLYTLRVIKIGEKDDSSKAKAIDGSFSFNVNPAPTSTPTPTQTPTPTSEPTSVPTATFTPTNTPASPTTQPTTKSIVISPTSVKIPTVKPTPKPEDLKKEKITTSSSKKIEPTKIITKGEVKGSKTSSPFVKDLPKILILFGVLSGLAMIGTAFLSKKINK